MTGPAADVLDALYAPTPTQIRRLYAADVLAGCDTHPHVPSIAAEALAERRYAVVIGLEDGTYVLGADTPDEVAACVLGALTGEEFYREWLDAVYDLDTGDIVPFQTRACVFVALGVTDALRTGSASC